MGHGYISLLAWAGAALAVTSFFMKTMIPLRTVAIAGHLCFLAYGLLSGSYYVLLAYGVTLPFNIWRLVEMKQLVSNVKAAADADLAVKWLHPFMKEQPFKDGDRLFAKGDTADHLYFVAKGRVRLPEIDQVVPEGHLLGEVGFFAPDRKRTQSAVCEGECLLYRISESAFKQLYYQNPEFGYYVVQLIGRRLSADIERLSRSGGEGASRGQA
ncbi:MAG: Crp/Fnr family transcriptional regulator [Hyphomicrobiaceae bacterium]